MREKTVEKLDGKSMDIVAENIEKLKEIFPDVFTVDRGESIKAESFKE
jgi:adenine-specific DNA-methyltransferase